MAEEDNKQNAIPNDQPQQPLPTLPGYRHGGDGSGGRKTWPELVGLASEEAERRLEEERPGVNVHVIPTDNFVTMDFRTDRVRVFTDSSGKVSRAPMIG